MARVKFFVHLYTYMYNIYTYEEDKNLYYILHNYILLFDAEHLSSVGGPELQF